MLEQKIKERRLTFEEFAEYAEQFARDNNEPGTLGVRHLQRLAAGRKPSGEPLGPVRPATARLLERIFGASIDELLAEPAPRPSAETSRAAGLSSRQSTADLVLAFDWLDEYAGWSPGTSRQRVRAQLARMDHGELVDRSARRSKVGRSELVAALAEYYPDGATYGARCGDREVVTSVATRADWLDLACPLTPDNDRLMLAHRVAAPQATLDETEATAAVSRLAECAAQGVRITNSPLYRLMDVRVGPRVAGDVGLAPFAEYALTMDLLEGELADSVAHGVAAGSGGLPLRDRYLGDMDAVLDVAGRLCAGGALALTAIARPHDPLRGPRDYALLVQERSGRVLNAAGRLAVIPKGVHEPLTDVRADARLGATLRREMEEELFGREDIDSTLNMPPNAMPMHPSLLSEPMRWLLADPGRLRMECTGFGLNLVSGNFEFASLIVIDDEEFWTRYGGQVRANWETAGLRLYSSLDGELITSLVQDETWSNEGLFALLQGLRRLRDIGGQRVRLPDFAWRLTGSGL
ncbi:hypothetical protein JOF53_003606 [Crossiella equi]|uniref:Transcriptional regulator n=1 Tax=Crossiella equi TaxID=130796 RepID=A0ABS5ADU2_9PSEU|nr:transcriptional regulator [Crossiella equi]MBP2474734.1 hypothetical protein [Crossiella equi]